MFYYTTFFGDWVDFISVSLKAIRDDLQKQLEVINEEIKPLNDVRYFIGKVIPLDNEVPTTEVKKSVSESISELSEEQKLTAPAVGRNRKNDELE